MTAAARRTQSATVTAIGRAPRREERDGDQGDPAPVVRPGDRAHEQAGDGDREDRVELATRPQAAPRDEAADATVSAHSASHSASRTQPSDAGRRPTSPHQDWLDADRDAPRREGLKAWWSQNDRESAGRTSHSSAVAAANVAARPQRRAPLAR